MLTLPKAAGSIMAALCLTACEASTAPDDGGGGKEVKSAAAIGVAPARLIFRVYAFVPQSDPSPQTLAVSGVGGANLVWSARTSAAWISLGRAGGQAPGGLQVAVSRGRLPLGYRPAALTGTITVSSAGATQVHIPVSVLISYLPPIKVVPGGNPGCGKKCN